MNNKISLYWYKDATVESNNIKSAGILQFRRPKKNNRPKNIRPKNQRGDPWKIKRGTLGQIDFPSIVIDQKGPPFGFLNAYF